MSDSYWMAIAIIGVVTVCWAAGEALFQYSLGNGVLGIKLFGLLPLRTIKLQQVQHVSAIHLADWTPFSDSSKASYLWCERWGGYMLLFRGVAITLTGGKTILIAPRNRQKVIAAIEAQKSKGVSVPTPGAEGTGQP